MNPKDFFDLVSKMRAKQKEYFKTKSTESLRHSKDLERRVDEEIKRVNDYMNEQMNPKLF